MTNTKKHFSEEFKKQIVNLYNDGKSVSSLVDEYSLVRTTIYQWIKEFSPINDNNSNLPFTKKDLDERDKRIRELELENGILKKRRLYSQENHK